MAILVLEQTFETPATTEDLDDAARRMDACLQAHGARWLRSYLSKDRKRMICEFEARTPSRSASRRGRRASLRPVLERRPLHGREPASARLSGSSLDGERAPVSRRVAQPHAALPRFRRRARLGEAAARSAHTRTASRGRPARWSRGTRRGTGTSPSRCASPRPAPASRRRRAWPRSAGRWACRRTASACRRWRG